MHWQLLLKEYGVKLHYSKGENNIVVDTLSQLDLLPEKEQSFHHGTLLQLFTADTIKSTKQNINSVYPLKLLMIGKEQNKHTEPMQSIHSDNMEFDENPPF